MHILLISNGHGEDRIASRLAQVWQSAYPQDRFSAVALVGRGQAYIDAQIPLLNQGLELPSQGFAYLHPSKLWSDLRAGLLGHLYRSWQTLKSSDVDTALAVGDIVALWAARQVRCPYVFVACALSDYYLGAQSRQSSFDPLQRAWLKRDGARTYARDALTAENLRRRGLDALALGNPMLEFAPERDTKAQALAPSASEPRDQIVLLPGSHADAPANLKLILQQLDIFLQRNAAEFLLPVPNAELLQAYEQVLAAQNWTSEGGREYRYREGLLQLLPRENYQQALQVADLALGLSGTANEQAVAAGLPVLSFAGQGIQYTHAFGEAQQRLLGAGLSYLGAAHPELIAWQLQRMLRHLKTYQENARQVAEERFGAPGAAERIVQDARGLLALKAVRGRPD